MCIRDRNRELHDYLDRTYVEAVLQEPVTGRVRAFEGEPLAMEVSFI